MAVLALPDWPLALALVAAGVVLGAVGMEAWWRNRGGGRAADGDDDEGGIG